METNTTYIVQSWDARYELWGNIAEPATGLFALPKWTYDTEEEGRARLTAAREANPQGTFRLVRQITTVEVI